MIFLALLTALLLHNVASLQGHKKPLEMMRSAVTQLSATGVMTLDNPATIELKMQILQLGASMDRGQLYNPTSGLQYKDNMDIARSKVKDLCKQSSKAFTMENIDGEWELVLSTVPHGIFRSSPFFMAIQQAYAEVGQPEKAGLFFKLHEMQTMSWGVSKIGRVGQTVSKSAGTLSSEFDTNIFALTVIPVFGWWKLLPTFGGCVVTESKVDLREDGEMTLEVDLTRAKPVKGLNTLPGGIGVDTKVPVGAVWKLLPWNKGRAATAKLFLRYVDDDLRVMEDIDGEYFVYSRPVSQSSVI